MKRTKKKLILIILLITLVLLAILAVTAWAAAPKLLYDYLYNAPMWYGEVITQDTVEKVTLSYGDYEEYPLREKTVDYTRAVLFAWDLRVLKRYVGSTPREETAGIVFNYYLSNGEKRTVELLKTQHFLENDYAFLLLDGEEFITEEIRYNELYRIAEQYFEKIENKNA